MYRPIPFYRRNRGASSFPQAFNSLFNSLEAPWQDFSVDVKETEDGYALQADVPGVSKENIKLSVENGYLRIAVKQEQMESEEQENYIRRERRHLASQRSFHIGDIKAEDIEASYKDGVLEVKFPKASERSSEREIPIQ